jgi:hypothetical protein
MFRITRADRERVYTQKLGFSDCATWWDRRMKTRAPATRIFIPLAPAALRRPLHDRAFEHASILF